MEGKKVDERTETVLQLAEQNSLCTRLEKQTGWTRKCVAAFDEQDKLQGRRSEWMDHWLLARNTGFVSEIRYQLVYHTQETNADLSCTLGNQTMMYAMRFTEMTHMSHVYAYSSCDEIIAKMKFSVTM